MSEVIGIGAAPRRKEDLRFLTGRGNYVADIQRPAMVAGVFARSPHAHAEIKSIDTGAARAMPGVLAIFTGADLKADGVNGLPCGWGIKGKNGQPMKEPPHPAMAQDKVRYVGDAVAFVVAAAGGDCGISSRNRSLHAVVDEPISARGAATHGPVRAQHP